LIEDKEDEKKDERGSNYIGKEKRKR